MTLDCLTYAEAPLALQEEVVEEIALPALLEEVERWLREADARAADLEARLRVANLTCDVHVEQIRVLKELSDA